jgi:hypothetical protein
MSDPGGGVSRWVSAGNGCEGRDDYDESEIDRQEGKPLLNRLTLMV